MDFTFLYLVVHNNALQCGKFLSRPFPVPRFVISDLEQLNCCNLPMSVSFRQVWAKLCFRKRAIKMLLSNEKPIIALGL